MKNSISVISDSKSVYKLIPLFISLFLIVHLSMLGCKKDSPTGPEIPDVDNSELLLDCLCVALVVGGTQTINVNAISINGIKERFTAVSDNPGVASVLSIDTTVIVTAVGYGTAKIKITSNSGLSKELPVRIYDLQILETDELLITFSQTFQFRWSDAGTDFTDGPGSYYHPMTADGFMPLGSLSFRGRYDPNGLHGVMVVKAKPGSTALALPLDYAWVWDTKDTGSDNNGSFWFPIPPPGYRAMGIVAQTGYTKPNLNDVVCVREDLTVMGEAGDYTWRGGKFITPWISDAFCSWVIEPPNTTEPHENSYLSTGTFVAYLKQNSNSWPEKPIVHPAMNVLKVKLPMLAETPYHQYVPKLTGYDRPPDETVPILAREMLVPCTIISDPQFTNNQMWRITNSPFYRLERQVFYKLIYHNHNQTTTQQNNSYKRTVGITNEKSTEIWNSTSISLSVEAGISFKFLSGKITASVSKEFGYSTTSSVSELQQDEYLTSANILPGKAIAIWQRYSRFVLKRHNGTSLETVKAWEFGINSYVTDDYPK